MYSSSITKVIDPLPEAKLSEPGADHPSPSSAAFERVGFMTSASLCVCISMLWGDHSVTCLSPLLHESFDVFTLKIRLQEAPKCNYHSTSQLVAAFYKTKSRILKPFPSHVFLIIEDFEITEQKKSWK